MRSIQFTTTQKCAVKRTARLSQVEGMFDVPPALVSERSWDVSLELPGEEEGGWNVGVIVGPSMAGKSTVARALARELGTTMVEASSAFDWPKDRCVVDAFPRAMRVKEITGLLSSVGFSSPPDWRKPFGALSNGGQFRVTLARALAEGLAAETKRQRDGETKGASVAPVCIIDEFTSVVDRTVARIGSAAVAKAIRRRGARFIAVTCHYDVLDWLEPDWVYEVHTDKMMVNDAGTKEGGHGGTKSGGKKKVGGGGAGRALSSKSFAQVPRLGSFSSTITI